jgi:predicted lipoprotein with Yx(FWY)xxD motif
MDTPRRPAPRWRLLGLRAGGGGLLIASGAVHLDLYLTGYRSIPTIGPLFILQVATAFALGALLLATGSRLAALAGAGFALSTLGGYLLTLWTGLFGFREVRTTAGTVTGIIEVAAFFALGMFALAPVGALGADAPPLSAISPALRWAGHKQSGRAVAAMCLVAVAVLVVSVAVRSPAGADSPVAHLKLERIAGVQVLTNASGFTLYWFGPDSPHHSNCDGSCAAYWPPVTGRPVAGDGVTARLGTIERPGGVLQVTYGGHPLYTYVGDGAPGQVNGNNIDLNGGLWHEMTASG